MLRFLNGRKGQARAIQDGDLVVVYESHDRMKAVQVSEKETLQNRFGQFKHRDWIGKAFGSKVKSCNSDGFVHLLAPTPELWTLVLQHRTQILYAPDISLVISFLELKPGSVVLESGTGSGSLTTCLARAVAPTGHVHTFEFHEPRATAAREEFQSNGLGELITVRVRDVESNGLPAELEGQADAIFLDLPGPWNAVPSAARLLRPDAPFCSFSPCIEQVRRTCEELAANSFTDIRTFEILLRTYNVRAEPSITELLDSGEGTANAGQEPAQKRQKVDPEAGELGVNEVSASHGAVGVEGRMLVDSLGQASEAGREDGLPVSVTVANTGEPNRAVKDKRTRKGASKSNGDPLSSSSKMVVARPTPETRGHTGYLTFARQVS